MVRYLILNTPKILEVIKDEPCENQSDIKDMIFEYGSTNGKEPEGYRKNQLWDKVKEFVSFGDVIPDDTTAKDRFLKDCFEKKKREAVAALGRGDGVAFNNIISRMTKDQASEVIEEYAKVKAHNDKVGRI